MTENWWINHRTTVEIEFLAQVQVTEVKVHRCKSEWALPSRSTATDSRLLLQDFWLPAPRYPSSIWLSVAQQFRVTSISGISRSWAGRRNPVRCNEHRGGQELDRLSARFGRMKGRRAGDREDFLDDFRYLDLLLRVAIDLEVGLGEYALVRVPKNS